MGWRRLGVLALGVVMCSIPAGAQDDGERDDDFKPPQWQGWGVRVGLADDPDQVLAGAQFDFGDIVRRVYLEPNVQLAVGDDHTILELNGALHYRFQRQRSYRPYVGGAIGIGLDYFDPPNRGSDTDLELTIRAVGGITWILKSRREFFLEGALLAGGLHDAQIVVGWRF